MAKPDDFSSEIDIGNMAGVTSKGLGISFQRDVWPYGGPILPDGSNPAHQKLVDGVRKSMARIFGRDALGVDIR